jgi:hypothetical protein
MIKMFFVRPGHFARSGGLWYEPGILMIVEPAEQVDIFVDQEGVPGARIGCCGFAHLDEQAPPAGLIGAAALAAVHPARYTGPRVAA